MPVNVLLTESVRQAMTAMSSGDRGKWSRAVQYYLKALCPLEIAGSGHRLCSITLRPCVLLRSREVVTGCAVLPQGRRVRFAGNGVLHPRGLPEPPQTSAVRIISHHRLVRYVLFATTD
jgi:hypothetical protein